MDETVNEQRYEEIPAAVSALGEARERARVNKDFATADSLKQEIIAAGYIVEDTISGYRLLRKQK
jgi:cysteinyl-tRNA synthetase